MTQRILIVEDSRTQAERLRLLLTREGYEVDVALNGREGLAKAALGGADLIISDVTMPEMDGFELCRAVRSSDATKLIPIILLTTKTSPADILKGLECGADNFIPKAYDDEYLLARVRRISQHLELRTGNRLEMVVDLTLGGREITVTADRQQMMELLFSTFEEMGRNHDALELANLELQQARTEADRANRAKSQFLSRMSHELRTPLNAVMGFGQLLEMATLERDDRESVRLILAAGRHLLDLINEVLDIGRIDAGELALSIEPVRTGEVLEEAIDLMCPLATERSVEMRGDACVADLRVMADRQRLKQVILNLLSNALKYNREGGTVTVTGRAGDHGRHRIEIADTGFGIAPENLDRLFAPFDRIGAERDTTVAGTGLGLALSKRLVEAMGGTLSVESEVSTGSTFSVELPAADDPPPDEAAQQAPPRALASPGTAVPRAANVLYVEDNASNVTLVERILARRPEIELTVSMEGRLAFELVRQHRPDMILLDLNLPDISGEEVLTQLRADPETQAIPIVIVTADASEGQAERFQSLGATAYLTKPFDVRRFLQVVDQHLAEA